MKYYFLAVIMLISSITFIAWDLNREIPNEPIFAEKVLEGNYLEAAEFIITKTSPNINKPSVGEGDILISIGLDWLDKESSLELINTLDSMGVFKNRIEVKNYLTKQEYDEEKGRFIYALSYSCYIREGGDNPKEFITEALESLPNELVKVAANNDISILECLRDGDKGELRQDMLETETLRLLAPSTQISINGNNPTMIIGIPEIEQFNNRIRNTQIRIGQ
jgi:hypothetical protein